MKIFSWGANSNGQLSYGFPSEQSINPLEIKFENYDTCNIVSIMGGGGHTLFLDELGKVYGCGWNNNGQLTEATDKILSLMKITAIQNCCIVQIACGWDASYVITQEGSVLVWGSNKHGQLGIPQEKAAIIRDPVKLDVKGIVQIAAGLRHAAMVTSEGSVLICGKGQKGQLGLVDDNRCPVLYTDIFKKVSAIKNVRQVACGQQHTIALTTDNQAFVWGDNKHGQLGLDPNLHPCSYIPRLLPLSHLSPLRPDAVVHVGWTHCAILSGGKVTNWGRNTYSQLGEYRRTPWQPQKLSSLTDVQQLVLGSEHNLALLLTGDVVSWGWNEHGNCGCGSVENVATPTSVKLPGSCTVLGAGSGHSFAVIK